MPLRYLAVLLVACSSPAREQPVAPQPTPAADVPALRLGHFSNKEKTVGVVIERREKSARMKLDGSATVYELDANRLHDRTDYSAGAGKLMLSLYDDGRAVVYLPDAPNGIDVVRDGDVDPVAGTTVVKEAPVCCKDTPHVTKQQPPEVKLKLGHYVNEKRGIGVVIDRTQHEAKVRFDGTQQTLALDPQPRDGRTDYIKSANHVVLQVWDDGRAVVYLDDVRDGIAVKRDGDADPL